MAEWQNRLSNERDQLEDRLTKLRAFIAIDDYSAALPADVELLKIQEAYMGLYLSVLNQRIEILEAKPI
jgi:hypothetical protein